jgi:hypothetical protein
LNQSAERLAAYMTLALKHSHPHSLNENLRTFSVHRAD